MSTTFHLACIDCKEVIWIGQNTHQTTPHTGDSFWYLYTGDTDSMRTFHEFMRRHQSQSLHKECDTSEDVRCHRLVFTDDQVDFDDYTEIDDDGTRRTW